MLPEGACTCAITRDGKKAGCASLEVFETEYGPRFREKTCGAAADRADAGPLARAHARFDAEQEAAARGGAPEGSMTAGTTARKVNGTLVRGKLVPVADADTNFDPSREGPPRGAMVRSDQVVVLENGSLVRRNVQFLPDE